MALPRSVDVLKEIAAEYGISVRPLAMRCTDLDTGRTVALVLRQHIKDCDPVAPNLPWENPADDERVTVPLLFARRGGRAARPLRRTSVTPTPGSRSGVWAPDASQRGTHPQYHRQSVQVCC
ncbi:hypothetical protein [Micromonospora sp. WMMD737]|uniref:hypothetical protein n=1 Tax=Micromonospora sp. WMMD737 TaxID=3404113 RepID=UPI003B940289